MSSLQVVVDPYAALTRPTRVRITSDAGDRTVDLDESGVARFEPLRTNGLDGSPERQRAGAPPSTRPHVRAVAVRARVSELRNTPARPPTSPSTGRARLPGRHPLRPGARACGSPGEPADTRSPPRSATCCAASRSRRAVSTTDDDPVRVPCPRMYACRPALPTVGRRLGGRHPRRRAAGDRHRPAHPRHPWPGTTPTAPSPSGSGRCPPCSSSREREPRLAGHPGRRTSPARRSTAGSRARAAGRGGGHGAAGLHPGHPRAVGHGLGGLLALALVALALLPERRRRRVVEPAGRSAGGGRRDRRGVHRPGRRLVGARGRRGVAVLGVVARRLLSDAVFSRASGRTRARASAAGAVLLSGAYGSVVATAPTGRRPSLLVVLRCRCSCSAWAAGTRSVGGTVGAGAEPRGR